MNMLLTPKSADNLNLKNRLILPPMATARAEEDGTMSQAVLDYYHDKTKDGNLSLVIVEHTFISEKGRANPRQMSAASDRMTEGLSKLSGLLHDNGALAVLQINHAGMYAKPQDKEIRPEAPSLLPGKDVEEIPLTAIPGIIRDFADAAVRCREAGFDAVEIHSAHGYLLNQFYSPLINERVDEYGGSLHNRLRLHREVIRAVKGAVGDFPVFLRLGAVDYKEGGSTIKDAVEAAKMFESEGIALLDVSGGFCGYVHPTIKEQGYFREITRAIKKEVALPVLLTGGITDLSAAEEILSSGDADFIGIGRAIYSDSDFLTNEMARLSAR